MTHAARLGTVDLTVTALEAREVPAAFAPGNLVVKRLDADFSGAQVVKLDEYTPAGVFVQTVTSPAAAAGADHRLLDVAGSSSLLTRSFDGRYLTVTGYDAASGSNPLAASAADVNRVYGLVKWDGAFDTTTADAAGFGGGDILSAATADGSRFWATGSDGSATQLRTVQRGGSASAALASPNGGAFRTVNVSAGPIDGQLYATQVSAAGNSVVRVGTGTPVGGSPQVAQLMGEAGAADAGQFVFLDRSAAVAGVDTCYFADGANGLVKFSFDGAAWTRRGAVAGVPVQGLTVSFDGSSVQLFVTNADGLLKLTDAAAFDQAISGAFSTLVAAAGGQIFSGVAWTPQPSPVVVSILDQGLGGTIPGANGGGSIVWRYFVQFSEDVTGVDASDFLGAYDAAHSTTIYSVVSYPQFGGYLVNVRSSFLPGISYVGRAHSLKLVDNGSILNQRLAPLGGLGFQDYARPDDYAGPRVLSLNRLSPTAAVVPDLPQVAYRATFSEAVTGLSDANFSFAPIPGSSAAGTVASVTPVAGSGGTQFDVVVARTGGSGALQLGLSSTQGVRDLDRYVLQGPFLGETYTFDPDPPRVLSIDRSVTAVPGPPWPATNGASVRWAVIFSEAVSGVSAANFSLAQAGVTGAEITGVTMSSSWMGDGYVWLVTASTGTGDGQLGLNLSSASGVIDAVGNAMTTTFTGQSYAIDKTPPAVVSIVPVGPAPTSAARVQFAVTFSEAVSGVSAARFSLVSAGTIAGAVIRPVGAVTGSGTAYTVTVDTGTGEGTIRLDLNGSPAVRDAGGNAAPAYASGQPVTIDRLPAVASIAPAGPSPTSAATLTYAVTFTEAVTGVAAAHFSLAATGGVAGPSVASVAGSGLAYTVTVNAGTGDGTIRLDFNGSPAVRDATGNAAPAFSAGQAAVVDRTPPRVASITPASPASTSATTVAFIVTFTEAVTGLAAAHFSLAATGGVSDASVASVAGSGLAYTVAVNTGAGEGTLRLDFDGSPAVEDAARNAAPPFSAGQALTIDDTAPAVASVNRFGPSAATTNAATVQWVVAFSEAVLASSVRPSDFLLTLVSGSVAGAGITGVSVAGNAVTVTATTGSGDGVLRLDVPALATITDPAGNALASGLPYAAGQTYQIDKTSPAVASITRLSSNPTNAAQVSFRVTFSEAVTGVGMANFSIVAAGPAGASVASVTGSGTVYTVLVNAGSGDGSLRLDFSDPAGVADLAGNAPPAYASGESFTIDRTPPAILSITGGSPQPTNAQSVTYVVTFSEAVAASGVDVGDFQLVPVSGSVSGAAITGVAVSGNAVMVTIRPGTGDGAIRLVVPASSSFADPSGNAGPSAASGPDTRVDTVRPTASLALLDPPLAPRGVVRWAVNFSEAVSGLDAADFAPAGTVAGYGVISVTGSGASYVVTAGTGTGDGLLRLRLVDQPSINDFAGNQAVGSTESADYAIDNTPPRVTAVTRVGGPLTRAADGTVAYDIAFSEPPIGLGTSSFFASAWGGVQGAVVEKVESFGNVARLTVRTGAGTGFVIARLLGSAAFRDAAGNAVNQDYLFQEFTIDRQPPVLTEFRPLDPQQTSATAVSYVMTFSEGIAGMGYDKFATIASGLTGAGVTMIRPNDAAGTQWVVQVATGTGSGWLRLRFGGGVYDAVGNYIASAAESPTYLVNRGSAAQRPAPPSADLSGFVAVAGDVNSDGVADFATATPNGRVTVFDGRTAASLASYDAWSPVYVGATAVALGDFDGDGKTDLAAGTFVGGRPLVRLFDPLSGSAFRDILG